MVRFRKLSGNMSYRSFYSAGAMFPRTRSRPNRLGETPSPVSFRPHPGPSYPRQGYPPSPKV